MGIFLMRREKNGLSIVPTEKNLQCGGKCDIVYNDRFRSFSRVRATRNRGAAGKVSPLGGGGQVFFRQWCLRVPARGFGYSND